MAKYQAETKRLTPKEILSEIRRRQAEMAKGIQLADSLETYDDLPAEKKLALHTWILERIVPTDYVTKYDSYKLKHIFEYSKGGFYVTNGMFKAAMLKASFEPANRNEPNWRFKAIVRDVRNLEYYPTP